jgi:hypothetical protein
MALSNSGTLGQGFASAMDPWQPKPFQSPFGQASSTGPSRQGPSWTSHPKWTSRPVPSAPPPGTPLMHLGAPPPGSRPALYGVQMPGVQMDGGTPQAFPSPTVLPGGGPGMPPPGARPLQPDGGGIAPGLQPPAQTYSENRSANKKHMTRVQEAAAARRAARESKRKPGPNGVALGSGATAY